MTTIIPVYIKYSPVKFCVISVFGNDQSMNEDKSLKQLELQRKYE